MASRLLAGSKAGAVLVFAAAAVVSTTANAQAPNLRMVWSVEDVTTDYNWGDVNGNPGGFGSLNAFGDYQVPDNSNTWTGWNYAGSLVGSFQSSATWELEWNCVFNDDVEGVAAGGGAFVTANIVVTNNDVATQNFTLLMSLPVAAIINPVERGSVVGTVTDLTLDGATVSAPSGARIYTPLIDGVNEAPGFLMNDPFSESASPLNSNTVGPADFGLPVPVAASQDVDTSIAIFLNFDLSAGDSASFTAIFEVLPVPGAGGLPLLAALGLLGGRRRRRR